MNSDPALERLRVVFCILNMSLKKETLASALSSDKLFMCPHFKN